MMSNGIQPDEEGKSASTCEVLFFVLSGIIIFGGMALIVSRYAQRSGEWRMQDQLIIKEDSDAFYTWEHPKAPVLMKFYIFNITNVADIQSGKKPILTEHGPYTYKMFSTRFDIRFYPNNTVSYRRNRTLHFDPDQSVGLENDKYVHLNYSPVFVKNLSNDPTWRKIIKSSGIDEDTLKRITAGKTFPSHTVKEIIFGYQDTLLKTLTDVTRSADRHIDPIIGPFHGFNNSDDGLFLLNTGSSDFRNYSVIERWNHTTRLSHWGDRYANQINGTDGSFLKPKVTTTETRYVYHPEMRRSVKLTYEKDTKQKGIDTYRYHFSDDLLKNATLVPENKGFCVPHCYPSGVLFVGESSASSAIFLSLPHFYQGASQLVEDIGGMKPNKTLHDSYFHVEPTTGAVLLGQTRIQINIAIPKGDMYPKTNNVLPLFFPYLWVSADATLDHNLETKLFKGLNFIKIVSYSGYAVVAVGVIMLLATAIKTIRRMNRLAAAATNDDEERLIPGTSSSIEI